MLCEAISLIYHRGQRAMPEPMHSPLPWAVSETTLLVTDAEGEAVAVVCNGGGYFELGVRNARLIVEGVNRYERLARAAALALELLGDPALAADARAAQAAGLLREGLA